MEKSRVRVELRGGLGNQLFQAATGYALAKRNSSILEFEISNFRARSLRRFSLEPFKHNARIINTPQSILNRTFKRINKLLPTNIQIEPHWRGKVFCEQSYHYDERIQSLRGDCLLRGYFQSWRYFADCTDDIRRIFDLSNVASDTAKCLAAKFDDHTLSIHIRAGDFIKNKTANAIHGTLSGEYYQRAFKLANAARRISQIFCFSDNSSLAKSILAGLDNVIFVEGTSEYDDMFLMSRAYSHIIANSTFSYWSAWLANQNDPFVIAPRAWLSENELKKVYIGDLYPADWIML